MFTPALRGNVGDGAFEHFQEGLLHPLAADIAGNADVILGLADLVDLVDVDDAALGGLQVVIRVLQELEQDVLHVFADVTGLGQRRRVADGKRDVEDARQRLGQQRLAAAGRADQKDVALVDFDVVDQRRGNSLGGRRRFGGRQALVMIMDRDGQRLFGVLLADHVLIQKFLDLPRAGNAAEERLAAGQLALFLADDVVSQINAVGTDVNVAGTFHHRAHVARGLAAEATGGDAPAAETAAAPGRRRWRVVGWAGVAGATAIAGAIGIGHRVCFPNAGGDNRRTGGHFQVETAALIGPHHAYRTLTRSNLIG